MKKNQHSYIMISVVAIIIVGFALFLVMNHIVKNNEVITDHFSAVVPDLTIDELIDCSTLVVRATYTGEYEDIRVEAKSGEQNNYRNAYFKCNDVFYGKLDGELIVRLYGGNVAGHNEIYNETPVFKKGEEYVLFLYKVGNGFEFETKGNHYFIPGMNVGVFHISNNNYVGVDASFAVEKNQDIGNYTNSTAFFTIQQLKDYVTSRVDLEKAQIQNNDNREYATIIESTGRLKD